MCVDSHRSPINFAENSTTACFVQLRREQFDDCKILREQFAQGLNALANVSHIGKVGAFEAITEELFVPLLRYAIILLRYRFTN